MEEGEIEVDSIEPIGLPDITPELARASGFLGVVDLLKVANHGRGQRTMVAHATLSLPRTQVDARRPYRSGCTSAPTFGTIRSVDRGQHSR